MGEEQLKQNMKYLIEKYLNGRDDLVELIMQDTDSVKYILSEIDREKKGDYEEKDLDMIQDIAFYYI